MTRYEAKGRFFVGSVGFCTLLWVSGGCHPSVSPPPPAKPAPTTYQATPPPPALLPTPQELADAQQAVRAQPKSSEAHHKLGEIYLDLGRSSEAVGELGQAAELDPKSEPVFRAFARLYQKERYLDHETIALRKMVELGSKDPLVYLRLGQIYMQLNWVQEAGPLFKKALELDPNAAPTQLEMGKYEFQIAQTAPSIQRLQEAHRQHPDVVEITSELAQYLLANGQKQEAETLLRAALQRQPNEPTLLPLLAYCLLRFEDNTRLPEAVSILQKAVQQPNPKVDYFVWLGRAYERQNRAADAVVTFERAMVIEPAFEDATYALGRLYIRRGRKQAGERLLAIYQRLKRNSLEYSSLRSRVRMTPNDPNIFVKLAAWEIQMGFTPRAIMQYRRALEIQPNHPAARAGLKKALLSVGRRTEAQALGA